ncbi:MarR family winged helix-turn-helix transcriptional regulator [Nocardioides gilvus]|uniref:MarR family winged helix-turn-helix transcriptional regulator n=1 Tax=Nocardioides gilvus TaxID=1735589 RepID=UPI000D749EE0|nr:MarR family transcriptional regulator [Nocardioides gilvus]
MSEIRSRRDEQLDDLEQEVGVLMRRARKVVRARAEQVHPELSAPAYMILRFLKERGAVRASLISECFETDKGAVSRQVQHAIDLGLVERSADPDDKRASLLQLTSAGEQGLADVDAVRRERLRERLDEWDDEALAGLVAQLHRYNRLFDDLDQAF